MAEHEVEARVDINTKTVTLLGAADLSLGQTFRAQAGDVITWKLKDAASGTAQSFPVRVVFATPSPGEEPLFKNRNIFAAGDGDNKIRSDSVNPLARPSAHGLPDAQYSYTVELKGSTGIFAPLKCVTKNNAGTTKGPTSGGEKGGGPRIDPGQVAAKSF